MSHKTSGYHPVVPNITDDSMKEVDHDVETIRRQRDSTNTTNDAMSDVKKIDDVSAGGKRTNKEQEQSPTRQIIIGVLIVVIIILIILLIYQVYKYYNADEFTPDTGDVNNTNRIHQRNGDGNVNSIIEKTTDTDVTCITKPSTHNIPQHVKNLDNDYLSQYIKKSDNTSKQRQGHVDHEEHQSARTIKHESMLNDTACKNTSNNEKSEMSRISQIIDETHESQTSGVYTDNTDIPSREDILSDLRQDIDDDKYKSTTLPVIDECNVIDNFLADEDDSSSVKSEGCGCLFELTKGKNRGQTCGRKRINDTRCARHEYK